MLTEREQYIKKIFLPDIRSSKKEYLSEEEVLYIIKKIGLIGISLGFRGVDENKDARKSEKRKHKLDVWIAKEAKKDLDVLDKDRELRLIKDWVLSTNADLFKYNLESALDAQKLWHKEMIERFNISDIEIPDINDEKILFKCADQAHFFYLLDHKDLDYEATALSHCVSGGHYKTRVKKGRSIIISLRDIKNIPQVTIEFDASSGRVLQQYGFNNKEPHKELRKLIVEFALYVCDYDNENRELQEFLNLQYIS